MPRTDRNTENVRVTTYVVVLESSFNPYAHSYHRVTKHAMIGRTFSRALIADTPSADAHGDEKKRCESEHGGAGFCDPRSNTSYRCWRRTSPVMASSSLRHVSKTNEATEEFVTSWSATLVEMTSFGGPKCI